MLQKGALLIAWPNRLKQAKPYSRRCHNRAVIEVSEKMLEIESRGYAYDYRVECSCTKQLKQWFLALT
jgi:hypothetical protein